MKKMFVAGLLVTSVGSAQAGGQEGSIGVGAEFQLSGAGGVSLNYDAGAFHVGGFFGYVDPANEGGGTNDDAADVMFGGRFFYHAHSTAMSDFGIGAGLGVISDGYEVGGDQERASLVYFEPSIQIRLFLASNVAVSFTTGLMIGLADAQDPSGPYADGAALTGQVNALAGVHYYFF